MLGQCDYFEILFGVLTIITFVAIIILSIITFRGNRVVVIAKIVTKVTIAMIVIMVTIVKEIYLKSNKGKTLTHIQ